jgi:hypothetical protein
MPGNSRSGPWGASGSKVKANGFDDARPKFQQQCPPITLDSNFKKRPKPKEFSKPGSVFLEPWVEPAGDLSKSVVSRDDFKFPRDRYGEPIHSEVRSFVIIDVEWNSSLAVPISTYEGRGVAKAGTVKSHHVIIYTGREIPAAQENEMPRSNEQPIQPIAIWVHPDVPSDTLDPMSRLNLRKVCTIEHNVKVKPLGMYRKSPCKHLWSNTIMCGQDAPRPRTCPFSVP